MTELKSQTIRLSVQGRRGADALQSALSPAFGEYLLESEAGESGFTAEISLCRLKKIQIYSGRYDQAYRLKLPNARSYVQGFPIRGGGEYVNNGVAFPSSPDRGMLAEPGELNLTYGSNFAHLSVFMNPDALSQVLAALLGTPLAHQLKLDRSHEKSRPDPRLSRRLVHLLAAELADEDSPQSPIVVSELEQAVLMAFLCGASHNYSPLLVEQPRGASPWQVRRVEDYVEANWDQPIAIEALAIVANASARSIFHSFRQHRGCSPMHFVKQVRLRHGREMLGKPASGATVTSVAFACGFGNLGHFAKDYQQVFGETPSATLNRSRGQTPS